MNTNKGITRREIIKGAAAATAVASIGGLASCSNSLRARSVDGASDGDVDALIPPSTGGEPDGAPDSPVDARIRPDGPGAARDSEIPTGPVQGRSTVVTIQNSDSQARDTQSSAVQSMVDFMLSTLAGGASNPWSKLLSDADPASARIGLKVNCAYSIVPTSPVLLQAIINSLVSKGQFLPSNIVVWENYLSDIKQVKYTSDILQGARVAGTCESPPSGDRPPSFGSGPGYGDSWGDVEGSAPPNSIRPSKILTEQTDFTINCPVLKAHPQAGFTASLKNCYGMFEEPGRFHPPYLAKALPKIYAIPPIRNSIKLTIVDSIRASVTRDNYSPADRAPGRISASLDPLALDYYALDLCNQLRAMGPGPRPPIARNLLDWMEQAYQLGLGTRDYNLVSLDANGNVVSNSPDGGLSDASG